MGPVQERGSGLRSAGCRHVVPSAHVVVLASSGCSPWAAPERNRAGVDTITAVWAVLSEGLSVGQAAGTVVRTH